MVASRLVGSSPLFPELPPRLFATGEEPEGIKVIAYHKSRAIRTILNTLNEEEIAVIQESSFGKFISLAEEPTFSGRFARFIMSRQLKTEKKHEAWFLFAGKPVRFSLREFAIVTGLPCGKYPQKSKKRRRKNITEKPYWPSLFGKLESVTVKLVIRMLEKKTVSDKETRIKYACLALLASVLMPTTHVSKISKEHAEIIKDLDEFFAYPWGRLSFDLVMSSIKERDEVSLSQKTISIPGFALSLQLVMMAAIPALATVVVKERCVSSSEFGSEEEDEEDEESPEPAVMISLNPGHARKLCANETTLVQSIISDEGAMNLENASLSWSDDEDDSKVNNLLKLINDGHNFTSSMFIGGATRTDVVRMREEAKSKNATERKGARRGKRKVAVSTQSEFDVGQIATRVAEKMKVDLTRIDDILICTLSEIRSAFSEFQAGFKKDINESMELMQSTIIGSIKQLLERSTESLSKRNDAPVHPNMPYFSSPTRYPTEALRTANDGVESPDSLFTATKKKEEEMKKVITENRKLKKVITEKDETLKKVIREKGETMKKVIREKDETLKKVIREKDETLKKVIREKDETLKKVITEKNEELNKVVKEKNKELKKVVKEMNEKLKEERCELEGLEDTNSALLIKERQSNDEIQEARKEFIRGLRDLSSGESTVGIKRVGEVDDKPLAKVCEQRFSGKNVRLEHAMLCSKWQENLRDPAWYPFKRVETGEKMKEVVDEEDEKLKNLRQEWGEDVKNAVKTALEELNEFNPSGRYPIPVLWNHEQEREATLKEGISHMTQQIKHLKRKRT